MEKEKQQTALEFYRHNLMELASLRESKFKTENEIYEQAKEMQQEQAQLYATFVLMCVNNNLPPITFNDWVGNIQR
jgi:hypothetical protein